MGAFGSSSRKNFDYDLLVVGAGSAGLTAAKFGADLGARVLLIERRQVLGGDCTWYGCVPSKALIAAGHAAAARMGARAEKMLGKRKDLEQQVVGSDVAKHVDQVRHSVYALETPEILRSEHGVETVFGEAIFTSKNIVKVNEIKYSYWKLIICTGSKPLVPDIYKNVPYDTNETIFENPPVSGARLAVIGAGPIGCELAQACAKLGAEVSVLVGSRGLLPKERAEAREIITRAFIDDNIKILEPPKGSRSLAKTATYESNIFQLQTFHGSILEFDRLLIAVGRKSVIPPTLFSDEAFGATILDAKSGGIIVNKFLSFAANAYAAGDCIANVPQFTHVAGQQGYIAARNALLPGNDDATATLDILRMPRVTYTDPEVGSVGIADVETAVKVLNVPIEQIEIISYKTSHNDRALCEREDPDAFVELVLLILSNGKTARILGGTVIGSRAGELLCEIALIAQNKLSTLQVAKSLHPYPTHAFVLQVMCADDAYRRFFHFSFFGKRFRAKFLSISSASKKNKHEIVSSTSPSSKVVDK
mmetsp:Transcript_11063/g.15245  ORF Transcript_11063/g.15245 Transcript_11063/m.15245 type:complete len:535 (-) Transcript_11063:118-1722(-)